MINDRIRKIKGFSEYYKFEIREEMLRLADEYEIGYDEIEFVDIATVLYLIQVDRSIEAAMDDSVEYEVRRKIISDIAESILYVI